jgi:hypothetical protein
MQDKIELEIETVKLVQQEMRELRIINMELRSQLDSVGRIVSSLQMHMPTESSVEYVPTSLALINKAIEMAGKKEEKPKVDK